VPKKRGQSERSFRAHRVAPFLAALEGSAYFPIQQTSIKGDADYILCCAGRFVWLELKKSGEKPTALQKFKADWVRKTGGIVLVADPDNWPEIQTALWLLDKGGFPRGANEI
jgi:hypothetical protein